MEYYAIDRIEENYAVCEKDGETMVNISRALLPDGAGEGNVLRRLPDGSFVPVSYTHLLFARHFIFRRKNGKGVI